MKPGPALSQKLGPAGINIGQVISKVNEATKNFKGMKVPVELDVNTSTKEFKIKVFSPPVSELLKKEYQSNAAGMQQMLNEFGGKDALQQLTENGNINHYKKKQIVYLPK